MSKSLQARQHFLQACQDRRYHNKRYGHNVWMEILTKQFNLTPLTQKLLNTVLPDTIINDSLSLHHNRKQIVTQDNKLKNIHFYFIENEFCTDEQLMNTRSWEGTYYDYTLPIQNENKVERPNKRSRENEGEFCLLIIMYWVGWRMGCRYFSW